MDGRLHLLGIRHHGPGSAALLRRSLSAIDPACVLIEGPPEGDGLIGYAAEPGMKPPLALLVYGAEDANAAIFVPFAEFSPEWQAMRWALERGRPVRLIDWPAGVSLAVARQEREALEAREGTLPATLPEPRPDPLDLLAEAAGHEDGEAFWNELIEQSGGQPDEAGRQALAVFAGIEAAMTSMREYEVEAGLIPEAERLRHERREAFMRGHIRQALK